MPPVPPPEPLTTRNAASVFAVLFVHPVGAAAWKNTIAVVAGILLNASLAANCSISVEVSNARYGNELTKSVYGIRVPSRIPSCFAVHVFCGQGRGIFYKEFFHSNHQI